MPLSQVHMTHHETIMVCAGYWSSWMGLEVCNSKEMKGFLGIGAEDSCLGFYLVGNSERTSTYILCQEG